LKIEFHSQNQNLSLLHLVMLPRSMERVIIPYLHEGNTSTYVVIESVVYRFEFHRDLLFKFFSLKVKIQGLVVRPHNRKNVIPPAKAQKK